MDAQDSNLAGEKETPEPLPQAVAENGNERPISAVENPPVHAAASIIAAGGFKGGRQRIDGLVPGSTEAERADALYERVRKWAKNHPGEEHPDEKDFPEPVRDRCAQMRNDGGRIARAVRREQATRRPPYLSRPSSGLPPPLPSISTVETPGSEIPTADSVAAAAVAALEAWQGTDIEPVLEEFLTVLQELREMQRERRLLVEKLPPELAQEILKDSPWPEKSVAMFLKYASRVLAKLANQAGIPIQYKDEICMCSAMGMILLHEIRLERRITKAVADLKKNPLPK